MLFEKHHCADRLRAQANKAGHPATEDPEQTFRAARLGQYGHDGHLAAGAHDARLDDVDGRTAGGRDKPGG